jgi:hypothetical protein
VTSHSRIAGARLFSEVVTGDEGRAMTLDSVPSEARPPDVIIHDLGAGFRTPGLGEAMVPRLGHT